MIYNMRKSKLSTPRNEIQSTTKETHKRTITRINTAQPTSSTTLMVGCGVPQLFTSTYMILIIEFFIIDLIIFIIIYTIIKHPTPRYDGDIGKNKRVIYTLNPETQMREVVGEWHFNDTDLSLCKVPFANANPK